MQLLLSENKNQQICSTQLNKQTEQMLPKCVFVCMSTHIVALREYFHILNHNVSQINPVLSLTSSHCLDYPKDFFISTLFLISLQSQDIFKTSVYSFVLYVCALARSVFL